MKKTKIICTLGPASDSEEKLKELISEGMNCARINFSHGTHAEQKVRMDRVKKVRNEMNVPLPILLDTKGPEIRVTDFKDGIVEIKEGDLFTFYSDPKYLGDKSGVGVTYPDLAKFLKKGDIILADDGLLEFKVLELKGKDVLCTCLVGNVLKNHKSINVPNVIIDMPYISKQDKEDIIFGINECVDYIAASFVRRKEDVLELRKLLDEYDTSHMIKIISKIENTEGISKMDEIIEVSDGIMVARGDMGVEVPFWTLPPIQKEIINKCYLKGKLVITATQMLDSMQYNPRPTRAEVSDVSNAVFDGTTAIMLSGESAAGKYPKESVRVMNQIAINTEEVIDWEKKYYRDELILSTQVHSALCNSAVAAAFQIDAKAIISVSMHGITPFVLSSYRPKCPIIAITVNEKACRQLNLAWNVFPIYAVERNSLEELFSYAIEKALESKMVKKGDTVIITGGSNIGTTMTDTMKIVTL